jgi:tRNA threonylcarbamoyladenosine biosynthesis protein TsaB
VQAEETTHPVASAHGSTGPNPDQRDGRLISGAGFEQGMTAQAGSRCLTDFREADRRFMPRKEHPLPGTGEGWRSQPGAGKAGGQTRNRTEDTRIFSPLLYQLSYLAPTERPEETAARSGVNGNLGACAPLARVVSSTAMPSLREIFSAHGSVLLLDAASERIQAGWHAGAAVSWAESAAEAGDGLFRCLDELGADPATVAAFAFCEGPGSILGIRTGAMAIRTWCALSPRPCYRYQSLAVVAAGLGDPAVTVVADARREAWHAFRPGAPLRRVPASELTGPCVMPEGFRHWSAAPAGLRIVPYRLAELFGRAAVAEADLFTATDAPDAFLHEEPAYAAWTPQIHRAPATP